MNNTKGVRSWFVFAMVLIFATMSLLLWKNRGHTVDEVIPNAPHETAIATSNEDRDVLPYSEKPESKSATEQVSSNSYLEKLSSALERKNVEIAFFGKIEDQDGTPLPDVIVKFHVRTWTSVENGFSTFSRQNVTSGIDGRFEIAGVRGDVLGIDGLEKENYESEPQALRSFGYNTSEQFRSSFDSPVVFRMWKSGTHAELVTGQKTFHIEPDGRSYGIDLKTGSLVASGGGDIDFSIKTDTRAASGQTCDWTSHIAVVDGGLLEENDTSSSMYLAPENGYVPQFTFEQKIKAGQRGSMGLRRFYVKMKNGREYGRIVADMVAPYNSQVAGLVRIQYAINPSGSRILR